jgi:hypothetical protein
LQANDVEKAQNRKRGKSDKQLLSFDSSIDWSIGHFDEGIASDGFNVFIDVIPAAFSVPAHVPTNMEISIVLGEPRNFSLMSDCRSNDDIPALKYFSYYDTYGHQCFIQESLNALERYTGCTIPIFSYAPVNNSCYFLHMAIFAMIGYDAGSSVDSLFETIGADEIKRLGSKQSVSLC